MIPSPRRRLVGAAAALVLLGATLLSTSGVAVASPPRWVMTVTPLPATVTPGADAGYLVSITNNGPSNISQLYLVNDPKQGNPTFVGSWSQGSCTGENVQLLCTFGALNALQTVTVVVGYTTTGSGTFNPNLEGLSGGTTYTDPNHSHGDTLVDPNFKGTILSTNKNFGGGFTTNHNGSIENGNVLNGQNKQSEKISHLPNGIVATVQDGSTTGPSCTSDGVVDCNKLIGEWTILSVNGGADFHPGYFIVQVTFKTGTPLYFVHAADGIHPQEDILPCVGGVFDTVHQCFTWDAASSTATVYLFRNGGLKG